ncbi:MAG TPA: hypothetical protein VK147_03210 [Candidatus Didemnitutus sp.]|nr:hypothetical protein [Candidatus Didemnitutus sp.]
MDPYTITYTKQGSGLDVVVESYEHEQHPKRHIVTERTRVVRNDDIIEVMCRFSVTPSGYDEVSITIHRNGEMAYEWNVSRAEMLSYISSQNPPQPDSLRVLLVDGPNPMFSWLNARLLSAIPPNSSSSMQVLQLLYRDKSMKVERYAVDDTDGVLTIDRGEENGTTTYRGLPTQFFPDKILEGATVTYTRSEQH